MVSDRKG